MPVLTRTDIRALLDEHHLTPSRALGQNFLADPNTARRITRIGDVDATTQVLEIGPGLGSLTLALADTGARVHALELDRHLIAVLHEVMVGRDNVTIEHGDALTYDYAARLGAGPWACVSNLPYNVATPVVVRLLEAAPQVTCVLVMVQREVGVRLATPPGEAMCGGVSAKVAYYARAQVVGAVPASVFVPRPKVESVLVRLDRRDEPPVDVPSTAGLFRLVAAGFAGRRKMLRRALRAELGAATDDSLSAAGIDPRRRAETLNLEEWAQLTRAVGR
jgi:16S rRNA (adenine1518-N6/adenine1519-N6)-dimethyltransferase